MTGSTASRIIAHRRYWLSGAVMVFVVAAVLAWKLDTRFDTADFLPDAKGAAAPAVVGAATGSYGANRVVIVLESRDSLASTAVRPVLDELVTRLSRIPEVRVRAGVNATTTSFFADSLRARLALYLPPDHLRLIGARISREGIRHAMQAGVNESESAASAEARNIEGQVGGTSNRTRAAAFSPVLLGREHDPLGVAGIVGTTLDRIAGTTPVVVLDGMFGTRDRKKFFVMADLDVRRNDVAGMSRVVGAVESVADSLGEEPGWAILPADARLSVLGRPVSYVAAFDTLRRDIRRTGSAAIVLIVLLLALFFRSVVYPAIVLIPVAFGLVVSGAVGFLVYGSVSILSLIFIGALVGLGVDFGTHIARHYSHLSQASTVEATLTFAVRSPGRGVIFGGLTSAAAFVSLGAMSYPVARQVAVMASAGILAALIASFAVLPVALSLTTKKTHRSVRGPGANVPGSRIIAALLLAILVAAVPASFVVRYEPHPWRVALRGNPKSAELFRLTEELGASFTPVLMASRGETIDEAIKRDRRAVASMRVGARRSEVVAIESITNWVPSPDQQSQNIAYVRQNPDLFSRQRFTADYDQVLKEVRQPEPRFTAEYRDIVAGYLGGELEQVGVGDFPREAARHIFPDDRGYVVVSYLYMERFPWAEAATSKLRETARMLRLDNPDSTFLAGEALGSERHAAALSSDLRWSLVVVLGLVSALLGTAFRRFGSILLCLVPVACGVASVLVLMALFRIELNMLTLSVAPLLVGIGIDDGIHIVDRLRRRQPIEDVFREAGSCMLVTTATTIGAFACLVLARFGGVREMGLLGAAGLATSLAAALYLVPLLARHAFFSPAKPAYE